MSDQRMFWDEVRRGIMQMVRTLTKARPDDRYTLEIRIVERRQAQ